MKLWVGVYGLYLGLYLEKHDGYVEHRVLRGIFGWSRCVRSWEGQKL